MSVSQSSLSSIPVPPPPENLKRYTRDLAPQASTLTRRVEALYGDSIAANSQSPKKASKAGEGTGEGAAAALFAIVLLAALVVLKGKFGDDAIRDFQNALEKPKPTLDDFLKPIEELNELLEESPEPVSDWKTATQFFDDDFLVEVLGISKASLHRYKTSERPTPDKTAEQLRWLLIQAIDLTGSYNEIGVRRWFYRQRSSFSQKTPLEILKGGNWTPDDQGPVAIRSFIQRLSGTVAT